MTERQLYLRRCNDEPLQGVEISRADVEFRLSLARATEHLGVAVAGDLETELSIRIPAGPWWAVEPAGTVPRTFTYTPLPVGQHRAPAAPA